jgi:hypothetical protein
MVDHGQVPDLAMIVGVEKAFFHCGKCITRSKLWNYDEYRAQAAEKSVDTTTSCIRLALGC